MKTTINKAELKKLYPCADGYTVFVKAHGDRTVKFSEALDSNGWDDICWLICGIQDQLSLKQYKDLRLLAADYAEDVLHIFEDKYPDEKRPREAIQAARDYANGLIDDRILSAAFFAAEACISNIYTGIRDMPKGDAKESARSAAKAAAIGCASVAWVAAEDARDAAWSAAFNPNDDAANVARDAKEKWQTEKLKNLFLKWEQV